MVRSSQLKAEAASIADTCHRTPNVCWRATEKSATAALVGNAGRDQIASDLAQQMLRERPRTTEAKALQFEKVFGEAAHGDLSVIRDLKRERRGYVAQNVFL